MAFTGLTVPLVLGLEGLTGQKNIAAIRPTQLIEALNISYENSAIQKDGGAVLLAQTPGFGRILGGWDWWPTPTVQSMVVYTDQGDYLRDDGAGTFPTILANGLPSTDVPVFVEAGAESVGRARKLILFAGGQAPRVVSGDAVTATALSNPPADWTGTNQPRTGVLHATRLWGAGNPNDPHRVYYSLTSNHEDFTSSGTGTLAIAPGEGERIVALLSYKGLLLVAKTPAGLYLVDTRDADTATWGVTRLSGAVGVPGPQALAPIENDVLLITQHGQLTLLSAVQAFGDVGIVPLNPDLYIETFLESRIDKTYLEKAMLLYYPRKREAHLALTGAGDTLNNRRVTVDFFRESLRYRYADRDQCIGLWLRKDATGQLTLVASDHTGGAWALDQPTRTRGGGGYLASFQTPHLDGTHIDPTLATRRKTGKFLILAFETQPTNTPVYVDVYWDTVFSETLTFRAGLPGPVFDDIFLDDTILGPSVAGAVMRRRVRGSGVRVSFRVYNDGNGETFSVSQMIFLCTLGSNRDPRGNFS